MKLFSTFFRVSALMLLSIGFWICACRENPRQADTEESEVISTVSQQEEIPDEQITELQRKIESGQQNIKDIEAFVQMERAKLKENPEYDSSFLEQALAEQQEVRESVELGEKRLKEIRPGGE